MRETVDECKREDEKRGLIFVLTSETIIPEKRKITHPYSCSK